MQSSQITFINNLNFNMKMPRTAERSERACPRKLRYPVILRRIENSGLFYFEYEPEPGEKSKIRPSQWKKNWTDISPRPKYSLKNEINLCTADEKEIHSKAVEDIVRILGMPSKFSWRFRPYSRFRYDHFDLENLVIEETVIYLKKNYGRYEKPEEGYNIPLKDAGNVFLP